MSLGKRLELFIEIVYKNSSEFAEEMGTSRVNITRYTTQVSHPDIKQLTKMYELGMSLHWLISGSGSMFADNPNGKRLKKLFNDFEYKFESSVSERIGFWIEANFSSIHSFAICTHLPSEKIREFLVSIDVGDPLVIAVLESAGCNTEWVLSGEGDLFNDNLMGCLLRKRVMKEEQCEQGIEKEFTFSTNQFMSAVLMLSKLHEINKNGLKI